MKKGKILISLILAGVLVFAQVAVAFAAPKTVEPISGIVQKITLATDPSTGVTTVVVDVVDANGELQTVQIGLETAIALGLVTLDGDGNPVINQAALGQSIEIDPATALQEEKQHPVALALSTFFGDIEGVSYDAIMEAHEQGNGFGVIAQVLWLTQKLDGDATVFLAILQAKKDGDFSSFVFEDGTSPSNWGQFKKAVMGEDKKGNLGMVMSSDKANNSNHENPHNGNNGNKDKDKSNNGKGNGNGNGNKP